MSGCSCDSDGRTFGGNPYPRTIHRSNRRTVGDSNMSLGSNETLPMWRRSRGSSAKREATVLVLLLYDRGSTRGPEVMHVEHTCRVSFETVRLQALRSGSQGVVAVMRKSLLRDPVTSLTMDPKVRLGRRLGPTVDPSHSRTRVTVINSDGTVTYNTEAVIRRAWVQHIPSP